MQDGVLAPHQDRPTSVLQVLRHSFLTPAHSFHPKNLCLRARLARTMVTVPMIRLRSNRPVSMHHSSAATAGPPKLAVGFAPTTEKPARGKMWENVSAVDGLFYRVPAPVNYRLSGLNTQQFRSTCKPWIVWKRRCRIHLNFDFARSNRTTALSVLRCLDIYMNPSTLAGWLYIAEDYLWGVL